MLRRGSLQMVVLVIVAVWECAAHISKRSDDQDNKQTSDIKCNVLETGIQYSTEICNKTNKTILKVVIDDQITAVIPTSPPTPPAPTVIPTAEEESSTQSNIFSVAYDEWDYDYQIPPSIFGVIHEEKLRHDSDYGEHFPAASMPPSWESYCEQAAQEDDEIVRITDGSFHPQYEVVPGLGVYRFHAKPQSWNDARTVCENEGAQLAIINSQEEADFLKKLHNRCPHILDSHFNDYQYLGVHDIYGEGKWESTAGDKLENIGYTRWAWGQPDNAHHFGEDCLTMNRYGYFNDVPCWTKLPFTCEHP